MKDENIKRLRSLLYFVGTSLVSIPFIIYDDIPLFDDRPTLEIVVRVSLLLLMTFVPDMVLKKIYPDYFRRINLDENDERGQTIKGKVAISTLKFIGIVYITLMIIAGINGDQTFIEYGFYAILLVGVYNKITHMSYEERT